MGIFERFAAAEALLKFIAGKVVSIEAKLDPGIVLRPPQVEPKPVEPPGWTPNGGGIMPPYNPPYVGDTSLNVMSVATSSLHFDRYLENEQEMAFAVIGNNRPVYFKVSPSPQHALPSYQKEGEIRLWVTDPSGNLVADGTYLGGVQNQISFPGWTGTYTLHAVTKGFSGWVKFQASFA